MLELLYKILEFINSRQYKMCLIRDLYLIVESDGDPYGVRHDRFAVSCAEEDITNSMVKELSHNPLAIKDCYPRSKSNMEKWIYMITTMLLVEDNCTEEAITHYKHSMYKLGLDDVAMIKVVTTLGQSNPKFQSAAISYMASVDIYTLTKLTNRQRKGY